MARLQYISDGIYRDTATDALVHRPFINGKRTERRLRSTTLVMARKELAVLKTRQLEAKLGIALDPYGKTIAIGTLAELWSQAGCPGRDGRAKSGPRLTAEHAKLKRLLPFWTQRDAREPITDEEVREFHLHRTKAGKRKGLRLNRTVDSEMGALRNIFRWAVKNPKKTGLRTSPMPSDLSRFDEPASVRHCTAVMPMTDEIVHQHAAWLLGFTRSAPLGWQFLLECLTGGRTSEILACRVDAQQPGQPGYQDPTALHINRLKKGIEPWALLECIPGHAPLRDCLQAFRAWHERRFKASRAPWFIPGQTPSQPMTRESLTRALNRSSKELDLPKITSHGCRAYFVRTMRSLGVDDSEIAKRLGHRGGVGEVEKTYGLTEPGWFGSKKMDFLPATGHPAWQPYLAQPDDKIVRLSAYQKPTAIAGKTMETRESASVAERA